MLESFHFIHPLWLLALLPLGLLAWQAFLPGNGDNPWRRVVDAPLLSLLMEARAPAAMRGAGWLLAIGWVLAVLALANPAWEREPQRVFQTTAGRVIVLDLSRSMNATDLAPSRLARARYRIEDVLAQSTEGQTGLVVYAGDAFTVAPLTRDANTIRALLKALDPSIMPAQGNRADLGLLKAGELLNHAGSSAGQVLLVADGVDPDNAAAAEQAAAKLRNQGYRVSVLGVGTDGGARATGVQDEVAMEGAGNPARARLDETTLRSLAKAGAGDYERISTSDDALKRLLNDPGLIHASDATTSDVNMPFWKERGPFLVLLLLPLAALAFRRNWLLGGLLLIGLSSPSQQVMASTWDDLWRRPDQQAASALAAGDYASASRIAKDPGRLGAAEYRLGNYQKAATSFANADGADAAYNLGNSLANLGRYQEAIAAYDKSLKEQPDNADAIANKAAIEQLLKKRQQEQKDSSAAQNQAKSSPANQDAQPKQDASAKQDQGTGSQQKSTQGNASQSDGASKKNTSDKDASSSAAGQGAQQGDDRSTAPPSDGQSGSPPRDDVQSAKDAKPPTRADNSAKAGGTGAVPFREDQGKPADDRQSDRPARAASAVQAPNSEEQMAAEQWLRRIPDDPGGLLRRKFLYQYRQRAQNAQNNE